MVKFNNEEKELLLKALGALMGKTIMDDNDYSDYKDYTVGFYNEDVIDIYRELAKKIEEDEENGDA